MRLVPQPRRALAAVLAATAAASASASAASLPAPTAALSTATWGFESWQCGDRWFDVRLGSGGDVVVERIDGLASAIVGPNADTGRRWVRAALVTFTPGGPLPPIPGAVIATPPERAQQAMSGNLMSVILKQRGEAATSVPVSQAFLAPRVLPGGRLRALVDTQTYTGDAGVDATVPSQHPEECLDSELQLVIHFRELSAAGTPASR